jgi:hypothetical protein
VIEPTTPRSERLSRSVVVEDTYAATIDCPNQEVALDALLGVLMRAKVAGMDGDSAVVVNQEFEEYAATVTVRASQTERPQHPGADDLRAATMPLGHEYEGGGGAEACFHRTYADDPAVGYTVCGMSEGAHRL